MIRVDHNPRFGTCWECGKTGEVEITIDHVDFHFCLFLCAVHWEELVLKLQGKPVPG